MTLSLKHAFNSVIADDAADSAAGKVTPTRWNAEHTVTGTANALFGFSAAGAALDLTGTSWNATDRRLTITSVTGPTLTLSESLAIGATIGTNALAVAGTTELRSTLTFTDGTNPIVATRSTVGGFAALSFTGDGANLLRIQNSDSGVVAQISGYFGFATSGLTTIDARISRNATGVIQFGTTSTNAAGAWLAAKGTLTGGTLADQAQVLAITATQPASPSAEQSAIKFSITSAGSASIFNEGVYLEYKAGYTGNSTSYGIAVDSFVAGTAANSLPSSANTSTGNIGLSGTSLATTVGTNIGQMGFARGGNVNFGLIGIANTNKNSATNIGVVGTGLNGGTSPIQIGGFFTLGQTTVPTVSAALIADNGAQIDPIFLARDNGSTVFTIADGGAITFNGDMGTLNNFTVKNIITTASGSYNVNGRGYFYAPATDGVFKVSNLAETDFGRLQLGGTTSSFGAIARDGAGVKIIAADGTTGAFLSGVEQTAPAAPAADGYRIFAQDNGGGKTQLMVIFSSGAAQQIAIQP